MRSGIGKIATQVTAFWMETLAVLLAGQGPIKWMYERVNATCVRLNATYD